LSEALVAEPFFIAKTGKVLLVGHVPEPLSEQLVSVRKPGGAAQLHTEGLTYRRLL
jgi:hypothetical protein